MELVVYKGEWGLASIDFECLRILAYCKIAGTDVKVNVNGNPFRSPSGMLPYLVADSKKITDYTRITNYLASNGYNANKDIDQEHKYIAINGHIQLLFENLYPFFMYQQWGDPLNVDTVRCLYAKRTPFPFSFYSPKKYVEKTNELVQSLADFSLEDSVEKHDTAQMLLNAKKTIIWLSEHIANNKWFFGDKPCEIDAVLYGYLSVILNMTLPNNVLQMHLKQCSNLVNYVERITKDFFAKEGFTSPNLTTAPEYKGTPLYTGKEDDETGVAKRKRYIISGLLAFFAMTSFAVFNGLLSVSKTKQQTRNHYIQYDEPEELDDD